MSREQYKISLLPKCTIGVKDLSNALPLPFPVHINYRFPVSAVEESERWKKILQNKLNAKCRALRAEDEPGFMNLVRLFQLPFGFVFPMCISLHFPSTSQVIGLLSM